MYHDKVSRVCVNITSSSIPKERTDDEARDCSPPAIEG